MSTPTPCISKPDQPNVHIITPLRIQDLPLTDWVQSLREHTDLCKKYGFTMTPPFPQYGVEPMDGTETHMDLEPPTDPESQKQQREEAPPATVEEMRSTGESASAHMTKIIENEVRSKTDEV